MKIDWCSYDAVKTSVKQWHYSRSVPTPPLNSFGVWENNVFVGCVVFSRGASASLHKYFGVERTQVCELTRIALGKHATPVSRIVKICLMMLRKHNPGILVVVSYADPREGHHGGVYKAGGWVYLGTTAKGKLFFDKNGKRWHARQVSKTGFKKQYGEMMASVREDELTSEDTPGKHRYALAFTDDLKKLLASRSQKYPCPTSIDSDVTGNQPVEGGASPTVGLQEKTLTPDPTSAITRST